MLPEVRDMYLKNVVPFADEAVGDYVKHQLHKAMSYIDAVIRGAMRSAPPQLKYHGLQPLLPWEEVSIGADKTAVKTFDINTSNIRQVRLLLSYDGVEVPNAYLYIPYATSPNLMEITGTEYMVSPVLCDTVLSPTDVAVFMKSMSDKIFFRFTNRNILKNDRTILGTIIYSDELYRLTKGQSELGAIVTPIAFYLLRRYGIKETFNRILGYTPIVGFKEDLDRMRDTHNIYSSTKKKPRAMKTETYNGHNFAIAIDKHVHVDKIALTVLLTSVISTLDHLPEYADSIVESINLGDLNIEKNSWHICLARILFKDTFTLDRANIALEEHDLTLESLMDDITLSDLKLINVDVNDFYEFIEYMISQFHSLINTAKQHNDIVNKHYDVLYYLLFPLIFGIHNFVKKITRNSVQRQLPVTKVVRILNESFSKMIIFKLVTGPDGTNLNLTTAECPGDNYAVKLTQYVESQKNGQGVKRKPKNSGVKLPEEFASIEPSHVAVGTLSNIPKSVPTPVSRKNCFLNIDENGKPVIPDDINEKLTLLGVLLNGKIDPEGETGLVEHINKNSLEFDSDDE
jgi:hypothetical protein